MRRRALSLFSFSFLDVLTCGLGAVTALLLLVVETTGDAAAIIEDRTRAGEAIARYEKRGGETRDLIASLERLKKELLARQGTDRELIESLEEQIEWQRTRTYIGQETKLRDLVFLIDLSGSMKGHTDRLLRVCRMLVRSVPDETFRFALIGFKGSDEAPEFVPVDARLVPGSDAAVRDALGTIDRFDLGGSTPTLRAFERAFALGDSLAVFVVTDGYPNGADASDPASLERIGAAIEAVRPAGCEIHGIGVGPDHYDDPAFREFMLSFCRSYLGA